MSTAVVTAYLTCPHMWHGPSTHTCHTEPSAQEEHTVRRRVRSRRCSHVYIHVYDVFHPLPLPSLSLFPHPSPPFLTSCLPHPSLPSLPSLPSTPSPPPSPSPSPLPPPSPSLSPSPSRLLTLVLKSESW